MLITVLTHATVLANQGVALTALVWHTSST
jgi:hypothetical protein